MGVPYDTVWMRILDPVPDHPALAKTDFLSGVSPLFLERCPPDEIPVLYHQAARYLDGPEPERILRSEADGTAYLAHAPRYEIVLFQMKRGGLLRPGTDAVLRISPCGSGPAIMLSMLIDGADPHAGAAPTPADDGPSTGNVSFEAIPCAAGTMMRIGTTDASALTVARNTFQILEDRGHLPGFLELRIAHSAGPPGRPECRIECLFQEVLALEETESLQEDFERYLQAVLRPRSLFDLIGPAMVGPSSSHTAGANRIGRIAREMLLALETARLISRIDGISVRLLGSFRDTGIGHRTPVALAGGLLGLEAADARMLELGDPRSMKENGIPLDGIQVPFLGFRKGSREDDLRYAGDYSANAAEILAYTDVGRITITGFSLGAGNVEVRYLNERMPRFLDGTRDVLLKEILPASWTGIGSFDGEIRIRGLDQKAPEGDPLPALPFNTFEELLEHLQETRTPLYDLIAELEMQRWGTSLTEIHIRIANLWDTMKRSVQEGLTNPDRSPLDLSGGDAIRLLEFVKRRKGRLFDSFTGRALAYATAGAETNARSGVVVACPTGGSCGVLPGVLRAYEEYRRPDERVIQEALMVAGFLGMILFDDVTTAGADYGCQAEIGSAAAMTAGALVHAEGGSAEAVVHAFAIALKNSMGLVCDPVAGLVEVPCIKRNGIYASMAIGAALMALGGVRSAVSPDEVVLAVQEVGERLHRDYKESSGGGLARTRDGKRARRFFEEESRRFFDEEDDPR